MTITGADAGGLRARDGRRGAADAYRAARGRPRARLGGGALRDVLGRRPVRPPVRARAPSGTSRRSTPCASCARDGEIALAAGDDHRPGRGALLARLRPAGFHRALRPGRAAALAAMAYGGVHVVTGNFTLFGAAGVAGAHWCLLYGARHAARRARREPRRPGTSGSSWCSRPARTQAQPRLEGSRAR